MVLRIRKIVLVGSLALVLAAVLLLAGPLSGAANASPSALATSFKICSTISFESP